MNGTNGAAGATGATGATGSTGPGGAGGITSQTTNLGNYTGGSATRILGTIYQNTNSANLWVTVSCQSTGSGPTEMEAFTDSSSTPTTIFSLSSTNASGSGQWTSLTFPVLVNNYYKVANAANCGTTAGAAGSFWFESIIGMGTTGATGATGPSAPTCSVGTLGICSPDGTTITVAAGVLTAVGGGGGTATQSYSHFGGYGFRQGAITATNTVPLNNGSSWLLSGVNLNNNAYQTYFNATTTAGEYFQFQFPAPIIVDEVTFYQTSAQAQGTWQWEGSTNGTTWTNIGSSFAWTNGANPTVMTSLHGNTTSYTYYRMVFVSGSTNGGPYLTVIFFRTNGIQ
jgi:hypothetical protein